MNLVSVHTVRCLYVICKTEIQGREYKYILGKQADEPSWEVIV